MVQTQALMDIDDSPIEELKRIANKYKTEKNEQILKINGKKVGKITDIFLSMNTLYGKVFYD